MTLDCTNIMLKYGSKGSQVIELQTGLKKLGYYARSVDGDFGTKTQQAVMNFQRATGHSADGEFGPKTCPDFNRLLEQMADSQLFDCPNIDLRLNSTGDNVKKLQTALRSLGYYSGKIDGIFGSMTRTAVISYQNANGHDPDGQFGPKTCKTLSAKFTVSSTSSSSSTSASNPSSTTSNSAQKKDPFQADTSKNVYSVKEANLHIDGIHLIATKITPNTAFHNGNWKFVDFMDGTSVPYQSHPSALEFTIECMLSWENFRKLKQEFYKMGSRKCRVACDEIDSGYYAISVSWDYNKTKYRKVTLKLIEWLGG